MAGNEVDNVPKKVDSELIAKNRGNAMIRYMEKRKTRRLVVGHAALRQIIVMASWALPLPRIFALKYFDLFCFFCMDVCYNEECFHARCRYDKRIRYESRKVRADTRLRFKGRFVKSTEALYGS